MKNSIVYGVGINDYEGKASVNGVRLSSYRAWSNMLRRCYDIKSTETRPTYNQCTVCDEWLRYSVFKEWYDINFVPNTCLDKDILIQDATVYSPETCCFVPNRLNVLLTDRARDRGEYPLGVSYSARMKKLTAYISIAGKNKNLGYFDDAETAHQAWVVAKKNYVRECANEAFFRGEISERVCNALVNRKFI